MYDVFISLGWFCGTAASMSKYGLRNQSGPFDWCFSEFDGVLHFLENDFEDFLCRDNLFVSREREFRDQRWRVIYNHDMIEDLDREYNGIYQKYRRRIDRVQQDIHGGKVCFLRAVKNQKEIQYILENQKKITEIVSKYGENDIVFIIPAYLQIPVDFGFPYYIINIDRYKGDERYQLRSLFDTNTKLLEFFEKNYSEDRRNKNKIFDLEKELKLLEKVNRRAAIEQSKFRVTMQIAKTDFDEITFEAPVIIYGAGEVGKLFCDKVMQKAEIECFLDRNPRERDYKGIPINSPENYVYGKKSMIVVIPTYDYLAIKEKLQNIYGEDANCVSIEELIYKIEQ